MTLRTLPIEVRLLGVRVVVFYNNTVFLLIFLLFSCVPANNNSNESFLLNGNISKNLVLEDLFDGFEYISLETSKESIFGEINKLVVYDERFYIHDNHLKKIFVFQSDGKFIQTIGSIGRGPGEYTHFEDFVIDEENNRIVILGYPSTVYVFDLNGNYIFQKQFMSLPVWNFCSYSDGFICSSNHQSFSTKNEPLVFFLDKNFNLKSKMGKALANNTLPPFISYPFFKDGKKIYYFDNLNSTMYVINMTNPNKSEFINFVFSAPIPLNVLSNPHDFIVNQANYCFFNNAFLSENILWAWFANQGKHCIFVVELGSKKQVLANYSSWFPEKMTNFNGYFYAPINIDWILEEEIIPNVKNTTQYPIDYDSNPVILRFKPKKIFE